MSVIVFFLVFLLCLASFSSRLVSLEFGVGLSFASCVLSVTATCCHLLCSKLYGIGQAEAIFWAA